MPNLAPPDVWVNTREEWIQEQALRELRSACEANDIARVRELYTIPPYSAIVDQCIEDSTPNVALLRCVLEDGASPESYATEYSINSKDTLELMAEFGHDITLRGHLILQYFAHSREIIDWMLDHGVDINLTNHGQTEDGFALASPRDTSLKILNSVGARCDIELYDHLIARGADQSRSLALHCATRCKDAEKSTAMIDHLLGRYHMDIEFDNEELRDNFDTVGDSGTPLSSAVYHQNLPAIHKLFARGARPQSAILSAIGHRKSSLGYLPALCPLLNAGADLGHAFEWAVRWGNIEAARVCLKRGADPTDAAEKERLRALRKAAAMEAGETEIEAEDLASAGERLPRRKLTRDMREFLRTIRNGGSPFV